MIEVVQKKLPGGLCCFKCKRVLLPGVEIETVPLDCKHSVYKKRNKKLKADHTLWFHAHVRCPDGVI